MALLVSGGLGWLCECGAGEGQTAAGSHAMGKSAALGCRRRVWCGAQEPQQTGDTPLPSQRFSLFAEPTIGNTASGRETWGHGVPARITGQTVWG